jgi:hypothetical protein
MTIQLVASPYFAIIKNDSDCVVSSTKTPNYNTQINTSTQSAPIPPDSALCVKEIQNYQP